MGEVWLAVDTRLGRRVAIKELRRAEELDAHGVDRLMREARLAANLHHPRVVAVHDLLLVDEQPVVVMEYVDGESLATLIRRTGASDVVSTIGIGRDIALALTAAHAAGIIHRDVKPANVLIDTTGRAKLADFGIARGTDDSLLTGTGQMIGTVAFMAPEIALGSQPGPAADIYSLGATLYSMIEGRAPFHAQDGRQNTAMMLLRMIREDAPPPERAGPLAPLLTKMMSRNPDDRPSAQDVLGSLNAMRTSLAETASQHEATNTSASPPVEAGLAAALADSGSGPRRGPDPDVPQTVRRSRLPLDAKTDPSPPAGASSSPAITTAKPTPTAAAPKIPPRVGSSERAEPATPPSRTSDATSADGTGTFFSSPTVVRGLSNSPSAGPHETSTPGTSPAEAATNEQRQQKTKKKRGRWIRASLAAAALIAMLVATWWGVDRQHGEPRVAPPKGSPSGSALRIEGSEVLQALIVRSTEDHLEVEVDLTTDISTEELWVEVRFDPSSSSCPDRVIVFDPGNARAFFGLATCTQNVVHIANKLGLSSELSAARTFGARVRWADIAAPPDAGLRVRVRLVRNGTEAGNLPRSGDFYALT